MGKMTVYHGGSTIIKNPKVIKGKNTKDFGHGFYCTIIREQAERWAKRYDKPIVSIYTVRMNTQLKILEFKEMTDAWLDFIIDCRHGARMVMILSLAQWQTTRFTTILTTTSMVLSLGISSGLWPGLNIRHIKSIFVLSKH